MILPTESVYSVILYPVASILLWFVIIYFMFGIILIVSE